MYALCVNIELYDDDDARSASHTKHHRTIYYITLSAVKSIAVTLLLFAATGLTVDTRPLRTPYSVCLTAHDSVFVIHTVMSAAVL